jgi:hypothetical protein
MQSPSLLSLFGASGAALCLWRSLRLRTSLRETSLTSAWGWGMAAEFAWLLSSAFNACRPANSALLDQLWLWAPILALTPFISALGAQRPTNRVWNLFILLPLLAVLGWPGWTVLRYWPQIPPLRVQAPAFVGFALVLVMGVGNYLGTRFALPALLTGGAAALALAPFSASWDWANAHRAWLRAGASGIFAAAVLLALRQGRRPCRAGNRFDRLWFDFQDAFGIVWAIRIQERINLLAEKERWACRIRPEGVNWSPEAGAEERARSEAGLEQALRWHLRRFVDPAWIDRRLNGGEERRDQGEGREAIQPPASHRQ